MPLSMGERFECENGHALIGVMRLVAVEVPPSDVELDHDGAVVIDVAPARPS